MADYPIVVVKEHPGRENRHFTVEIHSSANEVIELGVPKLKGTLRKEAKANGVQVPSKPGPPYEYVFEFGT